MGLNCTICEWPDKENPAILLRRETAHLSRRVFLFCHAALERQSRLTKRTSSRLVRENWLGVSNFQLAISGQCAFPH
jgi:hypothetical protein